jgi:hypothetical protein
MSSESTYYKEIIDKLERFVKKEYAIISSLGIEIAILAGILVFSFFVTLEMAAHFSSTVRTVLFLIFILLFLYLLIIRFIIPYSKYFKLFRKIDYFITAARIGRQFPEVNDDLLNVMQLVTNEKTSARYSVTLIDAAFYEIYNKTKNIDFCSVITFKKTKEILFYLTCTILICSMFFIFVPGIRAASYRLINFNKEFILPSKFIFEILPGNSEVTKGNNLSISVKIQGSIPNEVFLAVKNSDQTNFEMFQLFPDTLKRKNAAKIYYNYEIPAVRNSFEYFATAENIKSDTYKIDVIDRPVIKTFGLTINSPSYSKIPPVQQKDNGNVTALVGSIVEMEITSTKSLKNAHLEFSDTSKKELAINGSAVEGKFVVRKDNNYKIILTDINNNQNISSINYSIKTLYDAYPSIDVIAPNKDISLSTDNRLPLDIKISDDFGFTKLLLHYRLSSSKYEQAQDDYKSIEIPINKNITDEEVSYIWNLSVMNLSSDDVVSYFLEIFDNDAVSGPKSAKSSTYNIRVPSLSEILSNADNTQDQSEKELLDASKEAQELKQKFTEISQELRQDKKNISWQEKQKIEQTLDDFKKLQDKVNNAGKNIEKMQNDLQQNNLLSKETLQKYMDLQKLFDEMKNDDLKKAMEQFENVLQNMDRKMTEQSMENMRVNEEQIKQSIERTMNLLKRIRVEQKVEELLKRTDEISKQQNDVQDKTNKVNLNDKSSENQLSEKQSDITKDLSDYKQQLSDLSKKLDELKDLPKDQLDKIRQQFQDQNNEKLSDQALNNLMQDQVQSAQHEQSQILQNMGNMRKQMQKFQQSISQQSQLQSLKEMMKITDDLITLSKQQEALQRQSQNSNPNSMNFDANARQQEEIKSNLDKIMQQMSSLSQKSFTISPEMEKSLGDAKNQMNVSMENLQERSGNQAAAYQGKAMESLNETADMMKGAMEQMMKNGEQGGGMMSLMQQLQKMAGQQMSLNNMTQMLQQAMKGQLSLQQQAQLQRLAQQQDLIRKSLEQLNKEALRSGESKKIPADLNEIAKQMSEVVKNMSSEQVDNGTVQKQEHILSRLLEAQHSINQRDYNDKRESQSGKDMARQSPAELNFSISSRKNKVRDELNKALQEGYTKDYQELIRRYYEALQKDNNKN